MREQIFTDLVELGVDMEEIMDRFMEDKELYTECLERFVEEKTFDELGEKIKANDIEGAFNCAHSLKGVSSNLGLHRMFETICELVEPLRVKDGGRAEELYMAILKEKDRLVELIEKNKE